MEEIIENKMDEKETTEWLQTVNSFSTELANLANANQTIPLNYKELLNELTTEGKIITDSIWKTWCNIEKLESFENGINTDEYSRYETMNDVSEVKKELEKVREQINKSGEINSQILDNLKIILGTIYEGSLIDKEVSFRKGKIYRFRCQYRMDVGRILDEIIKHKEEVIGKLNYQSQETLAFVLNTYKEVLERPTSANNLEASGKLPEMNLVAPDIKDNEDSEVGTGSGRFWKINGFVISGSDLYFTYSIYGNGEQRQNLGRTLRKILQKNFLNEIIPKIEEIHNKVKEYNDKQEELSSDIRSKYAKQLVYHQMITEKKI